MFNNTSKSEFGDQEKSNADLLLEQGLIDEFRKFCQTHCLSKQMALSIR